MSSGLILFGTIDAVAVRAILNGERHDMVIPVGDTSPDRIVARGGHVISLTHPTDVNDFIRMVMTRSEGEPKIAKDSTLRAN